MQNIANSTIFITGGAGFVGSYIVEELLPLKPKKIIILDNLIRGSLDNMKSFINNPVIEFIQDDVRNRELVNNIMSESDYCFHLAALRINACAADPKEGFDVMVNGTFNIVDLANKHKIKKLIYSSSASVYGLADTFPTPETNPPYDNQTFYGASKLWGEQLLRSYYFMYGLDYLALRYFNIYGPRMDTDGKYTEVMIKWLDCIRDNKAPLIYGDGSDSMDFVYVRDVAKANVLALLSDHTDTVFNVGFSRETSLKELLDIMLKINNSNLHPGYMPANTVNPVNKRLADITKAKKLLGYSPEVTLEQGLIILSEWYFNKNKKS